MIVFVGGNSAILNNYYKVTKTFAKSNSGKTKTPLAVQEVFVGG